MRSYGSLFLVVLALGVVPVLAASAEDAPPLPLAALDLETAVELALQRSPTLEAMSARVGQAAARAKQAGLRPNPELRLELEDFAGNGAFDGTDEAQATIGVGQLLELGGKRGARIDAAEASEEVVAIDYERARRDLVATTSRAFVDVLVAQGERELAEETLRIEAEIVAAVTGRVRAGSSSKVELTKAEVALAGARIARDRVERGLVAARRQLAASWGDTEARFERAVGELAAVEIPPPLAFILAKVDRNPDLLRSAAEIARRDAGVAVEQRRAIPDVEVGVGYRRLEGPDDDAMIAEMRVPLPLFDRNQGAVLEAQARLAGARAERRAVEIETVSSAQEAHDALTLAYTETQVLDRTVLPAAATAFAAIRDGYREGRFSYLDLLDAARTLNDARKQRIDALAGYHISRIEIDRLIGEGKEP